MNFISRKVFSVILNFIIMRTNKNNYIVVIENRKEKLNL